MEQPYILAIDQGTSSTKTLIFDKVGQVVARASEPLKTDYSGDGYVEQQPEEIYRNVLTSVGKCLGNFAALGGDLQNIAVGGISNQRETFVVWNEVGEPLYNAIVWQCKRSIAICERLKAQGLEPLIRQKTGLFIDPYFSGTKLIWLSENVPSVQQAIQAGNVFFGTVDTWLLYKLTGGTAYLTDYTNASRTLFFNLETLSWDAELINLFGLSGVNLPELKPSAAFYGETDFNGLFRHNLRLTAMIGDSHAAAFGEGCFSTGKAKATLGTGCSILMNTGPALTESSHGMVSTVCWSTEDGAGRRLVNYALEGVIVTCGATIEWLKTSLNLFAESRDTEAMALSVPDNGGVYLVPAFSGLGAPHWQMERKASISGLTFATKKEHIVRAALESVAYQIYEVVLAMEKDTGIPLAELSVNGGLTANGFMLQFLTDLLKKPVVNQGMPDVSAQGVAYLAGLHSGIYPDFAYLEQLIQNHQSIAPGDGVSMAMRGFEGWLNTIHWQS